MNTGLLGSLDGPIKGLSTAKVAEELRSRSLHPFSLCLPQQYLLLHRNR